MLHTKARLALSSIILLSTALSIGVVVLGRAEGQGNVDWFSQPPSFLKENDQIGVPLTGNFDGCTKTKIQVVRTPFSSPFEEHCVVPTSMGLMKNLSSSQGVVLPQGSSKAYPVRFSAGGNPIAQPVPNQPYGIVTSPYSQGPGVLYGYFNQISNHMKLKADVNGLYYDISGADAFTDFVFRKFDNSLAPFNSGTQTLSSNGRYMVVDTLSGGFARINLSNLSLKSFAPTLVRANGSDLLPASTAVDDDGKYAAVAYNAPFGWGSKYFKLINVDSCPTAEQSSVPIQTSFNCQTVDLLPRLKQIVPTVSSVDGIRFINDRTITFTATYTDGAGAIKYAAYSMTAFGQSKSLKQYLALGDSYISGEGAHSYRERTDTLRNQCHQSLVSYPYLLGSYFNSYTSVACSGAKMHNVYEPGKNRADQLIGSLPSPEEETIFFSDRIPGANLQKLFVRKDNPEAITISIGGNDIGFGQILEKCAHPLKHLQENVGSGFTCYDSYEDRAEVINLIDSQFARLRGLYESLRDNGAGGRRVYVIGYPQIAKVGGDCGLNVQMNAKEIEFAHDLIEHLDGVIQRAADEAGVMYVDTQHAFDGHRLCEASGGQTAVNGFTVSNSPNGGRDFKASFHPNQRGHEMLAAVIAEQTERLTKPMPGAKPKTDEVKTGPAAAVYQGVPQTGRPIRTVRLTDDLLPSKVIERSQPVSFTLPAQAYQTKPAAAYSVVLGTRSLGNYVADANGNLAVNATLPAGLAPGFQTLHITGTDMFGNPIDIQQVVFVTAGNSDSDGDGLPDTADSCVLAAQSGTDADNDGIDDVCDPLIAPPVLPPSEPEGIVWLDHAYAPMEIVAGASPQ